MADLKVRLSLNTGAFAAGLKSAQSMVGGFGSRLAMAGRFVSGLLAPLAGIVTIAAGIKGIGNALNFGGQIYDQANRTGIAADKLVVLQEAFRQAGMSGEQVGPVMNRLQKALAGVNEDGEDTKGKFSDLGLSMDALNAMNPSDQFAAVAEAIAGIPDPAARAKAAMDIFGKSGGELLQLFNDPRALTTAAAFVGRQSALIGENAAKFDAVSDVFSGIGIKFRGFFIGLASSLLPSLEGVAGVISEMDLTSLGERLGAAIQTGITVLQNAFAGGTLGELAGLALKIGFGEAINFLGGGMLSVIDGVAAGLGSVIKDVFSGKTIGSYFLVFLAIPEIIIGGLIAGMARIGASFQAALQYAWAGLTNSMPGWMREKITGSQDKDLRTMGDYAEQNMEGVAGLKAELGDRMVADAIEKFSSVGGVLVDISGRAGSAFMGEMERFSSVALFDTEAMKSQFGSLISGLVAPAAGEAAAVAARSSATHGGGRGKGAAAESAQIASAASQAASDQFSKIGIFVGGSDAVVNVARQTANNTMQMVQMMKAGLKIQGDIVAVAG